jgi:hypothetical protein
MELLTGSCDTQETLCKHASPGGNQMSMEVKLQTLGRTMNFTKNDNKGRPPPWLNSQWSRGRQLMFPLNIHTTSLLCLKNFGNGNSDHFANQFCSWLARKGKIEAEKALPQTPKDIVQWQVGLIKVASASLLSLNM